MVNIIKYLVILMLIFSPIAWGGGTGKIKTVIVNGTSMSPLLKNGQELKISYEFYKSNKVKRGDVVIAKLAANKRQIVKKVYGTSGDTMAIVLSGQKCLLKINGKKILNSLGHGYLFSRKKCNLLKLYIKDYLGRIPTNSFLLLGDKASGTRDSAEFGLIDKKHILGKVILD